MTKLGLVDHQANCPAAVPLLVMLISLTCLFMPVDSVAQGSRCVLQSADAPKRQMVRCPDGLTIEAEAGADYTLLDRNRDGQPDAVNLQSRALFVDAPVRSGRPDFRILTPQALATAHNTQWAINVSGGKTAVFVVSGLVFVRRANLPIGINPSSGQSVNLGPGQGVDVELELGIAPLIIRRWPVARASALLARFGR
jgi:ferric-dicitrate binding protein FerR (iron transport regulator)